MIEKNLDENPQNWKMPDNEQESTTAEIQPPESSQEKVARPEENLDVSQTLSDVGGQFGIDTNGKSVEQIANGIQARADTDSGVLTKLGKNKLVKRLVLIAGMATLGMGLAERVSATEGDSQKIAQSSEKKEWRTEDFAKFIVDLKQEAQQRGMDETQVKEYEAWVMAAVAYMKDNGYDQSFTENFLRNDLEKKFELTEEQKQMMREMQQIANKKMEHASEQYPDISDSTLNRFQERAWDVAEKAARKINGMAIFESEVDSIYHEEFASQIAIERVINKEMILKGYQKEVNNMAEKASIRFGETTTIEEVNAFQKEAWKFATIIIAEGKTDTSFALGLQNLFEEHFKEQIAQERAERRKQVEEYIQKGEYNEMPNLDSLSDFWLQENSGKVFQRDGKYYVVASAESKDMQTATNKANLHATTLVARLLADMNNRLQETIMKDGDVTIKSETFSEVLRGNSRPTVERMIPSEGLFQKLVVHEVIIK